jgi:hypothetical protein
VFIYGRKGSRGFSDIFEIVAADEAGGGRLKRRPSARDINCHPSLALRHPCCPIHPRHPYLPKGPKGKGGAVVNYSVGAFPRLPNLPQGAAGASFPLSKAELPSSCVKMIVPLGRPQSTQSLTRAVMSSGNFKPSFASAERRTLNTNCVAPAMGNSAGFAPRRILSTYLAAP